MANLMWFREDLRIYDNTALYYAGAMKQEVIAVFVIDVQLWKNHDVAACRVEFILRALNSLQSELSKLNVPLRIISASGVQETQEKLLLLAQELKIEELFFNKQYEFNENERDKSVTRYFLQNNIKISSFDDQTILPPGKLNTQQGRPYTVFTPFKRAWCLAYQSQHFPTSVLPNIKKQSECLTHNDPIPNNLPEFKTTVSAELWPATEVAAQKKLVQFIKSKICDYKVQRDYPAINGTSALSPYLAAGLISARQCMTAALTANTNKLDAGNEGISCWIVELIWREFYKHILVAFPRISKGQAFKVKTEQLPWRYDDNLFQAWCEGKTGIPLVDAAMRQLNQTGWMHNRLRMVTAMFLSKNLFLNWRLGERYFMQHLIDGDLAANNGGWQWSASTGTDSVPYFRVFNPVSQSERFDPEGKFIRQYCPELAALDNHAIHDPHNRLPPLLATELNYPRPIVDLKISRQKAIEAFKKL